VLFVLLAMWVHRRHGAWAMCVPATAIALWFGTLTLGEQPLGWTS